MQVYLDILFLENLIINYFILLLTSKFTNIKTSTLRLFLGALLGAVYVLVLILCPNLKIYYTAGSKIVLSLIIIYISFPFKTIKIFLKNVIVFYLATFLFAGATFAFVYLSNGGGFIRNGIVYIFRDTKWIMFILAIASVFIMVRIVLEIMKGKITKEKLEVPIKLSFEGKVVELSALVDTGNFLHDPLTNKPVVIVEYKAVMDIFPTDLQRILEMPDISNLDSIYEAFTSSKWFSRFRLIPFSSLGKENGMLIGLRPDYIKIGSKNGYEEVNDVIIGIHNQELSSNNSYRAILGVDLLQTA